MQAAALLNITVSLLAYVAHRRSQRPAEIAEVLASAAAAGASADSDEEPRVPHELRPRPRRRRASAASSPSRTRSSGTASSRSRAGGSPAPSGSSSRRTSSASRSARASPAAFCKDDAQSGDTRQLRALALFAFVANVVAWAVVPFFGWTARQPRRLAASRSASWSSRPALLGAILPLVCHFGIKPDDRAGQRPQLRVSCKHRRLVRGEPPHRLRLPRHLAAADDRRGHRPHRPRAGRRARRPLRPPRRGARHRGSRAWRRVAVLLVVGTPARLRPHLGAPPLQGRSSTADTKFAEIIETKSGVITVTQDGTVYGGGAYDGRFNTSHPLRPQRHHARLRHRRDAPGAEEGPHDRPRLGLVGDGHPAPPRARAPHDRRDQPGLQQAHRRAPRGRGRAPRPEGRHRHRRRPPLAQPPPERALRRRRDEHDVALARAHHEPALDRVHGVSCARTSRRAGSSTSTPRRRTT